MITSVKQVNARALAWEIRKATGVNLGGYNETEGVIQLGSIRASDSGVVIECPADKEAEIGAVLDAHDEKSPMPGDFPADPPIVPVPTLQELYALATTDVERLEILAKNAGAL